MLLKTNQQRCHRTTLLEGGVRTAMISDRTCSISPALHGSAPTRGPTWGSPRRRTPMMPRGGWTARAKHPCKSSLVPPSSLSPATKHPGRIVTAHLILNHQKASHDAFRFLSPLLDDSTVRLSPFSYSLFGSKSRAGSRAPVVRLIHYLLGSFCLLWHITF